MRRIVVSTVCAGVISATVVPALAGTPSGQGAQQSGLSPTSGGTSQCQAGSGAQADGFAILNTAGKVGSAVLTNGEVSLKGATPDTTYLVTIGQGGSCTVSAMLKTNPIGNGNAHLQTRPGLSGSGFYVVVQQGGQEVYASGPVTLK